MTYYVYNGVVKFSLKFYFYNKKQKHIDIYK
jgi:hypothetical protein